MGFEMVRELGGVGVGTLFSSVYYFKGVLLFGNFLGPKFWLILKFNIKY